MRYKSLSLFVVFVSCCLICGCGKMYLSYPGTAKTNDEHAILYFNYGIFLCRLNDQKINGSHVGRMMDKSYAMSDIIALNPGKHSLFFRFDFNAGNYNFYSKKHIRRDIILEPGRIYKAYLKWKDDGTIHQLHVTDVTDENDKRIQKELKKIRNALSTTKWESLPVVKP